MPKNLQQWSWMGRLGTRSRHFRYPGFLVWLFSWGTEIRQSCQFVSSLVRALAKLPGGLGRFLLCRLGSHVSRLRHLVGCIGPVKVMRWMCKGFTLWVIGRLYVGMVRVVLSLPLIPGIGGFPRICMVSTGGFLIPLSCWMTSLSRLLSVVGILGFVSGFSWLREDLSSRPSAWLRPDFVPPSTFLVVKDPQTESSLILVEPHLIDAEFRKAWMPFFCTSSCCYS